MQFDITCDFEINYESEEDVSKFDISGDYNSLDELPKVYDPKNENRSIEDKIYRVLDDNLSDFEDDIRYYIDSTGRTGSLRQVPNVPDIEYEDEVIDAILTYIKAKNISYMDLAQKYCKHITISQDDMNTDYKWVNYIATLTFELPDDEVSKYIVPLYYENYQTYIQLSDNRTLWDIDEEINTDLYDLAVRNAKDDFERQTGTQLYAFGRMGRHICIDYTYENIERYDELCKVQQLLEKDIIRRANNGEFALEV